MPLTPRLVRPHSVTTLSFQRIGFSSSFKPSAKTPIVSRQSSLKALSAVVKISVVPE